MDFTRFKRINIRSHDERISAYVSAIMMLNRRSETRHRTEELQDYQYQYLLMFHTFSTFCVQS